MKVKLDLRSRSDFVVDTNSHCFMCLKGGKFRQSEYDDKQEELEEEDALLRISSFQYLSRYLNMDLRKVFSEQLPIPPHLLERVIMSKLKMWLCYSCQALTSQFSVLYEQFEKAEMGMLECLKKIHRKIAATNDDGSMEKFRTKAREVNFSEEKVKIAKEIRNEAMNKCIPRFRNITPQLKLKRLSRKTVDQTRKQVNQRSVDSQAQILRECLKPADVSFFPENNVKNRASIPLTEDTKTANVIETIQLKFQCKLCQIKGFHDQRSLDDHLVACFLKNKTGRKKSTNVNEITGKLGSNQNKQKCPSFSQNSVNLQSLIERLIDKHFRNGNETSLSPQPQLNFDKHMPTFINVDEWEGTLTDDNEDGPDEMEVDPLQCEKFEDDSSKKSEIRIKTVYSKPPTAPISGSTSFTFECGVCFQKFSSELTLEDHYAAAHVLTFHSNIEDTPATTQVNGNRNENIWRPKLSNNYRYNRHFETEKHSYRCKICDKKFSSTNNLDEHQQTIHLGRKFICPKCGKEYSSRKHFYDHGRRCGVDLKKASMSIAYILEKTTQ